jgi:hypothetical protein
VSQQIHVPALAGLQLRAEQDHRPPQFFRALFGDQALALFRRQPSLQVGSAGVRIAE